MEFFGDKSWYSQPPKGVAIVSSKAEGMSPKTFWRLCPQTDTVNLSIPQTNPVIRPCVQLVKIGPVLHGKILKVGTLPDGMLPCSQICVLLKNVLPSLGGPIFYGS